MRESSSSKVKLGIFVFSAITILALGFNFLKGSSLFNKHFTLKARYNNIQGLAPSNPVIINGLQVGQVIKIEPEVNFSSIEVILEISRNIQIPKNSIAAIIPSPLGNPKIDILIGADKEILKDGDTISTQVSKGIVDDVINRMDPVVQQVKKVTLTLDTLLNNINSSINNRFKNNLEVSIDNLRLISASLLKTSESINTMMDLQHGSVNKSMQNIEKITSNLNNQTNHINHILQQLDKTTLKLSELDYQQTLKTIDHSLMVLDTAIGKLNSTDGTMGLLLHDPKLYHNLTQTSRKLNTLLDDFRLHPSRYVSLSIFGKKKNKEKALTEPVEDSLFSPSSKP